MRNDDAPRSGARASGRAQLSPQRRRQRVLDERLGDSLGWLSVGLGLGALLFPRAICRATGMAERPILLRAVGVRELASGAGLLTQRHRTPWLWTRVIGDAMDLALVGSAALHPANPHRRRAVAAFAVLAPIAAIDLAASMRQSRRDTSADVTGGHEAFVEQVLIVNKSPQDCYAFWRDLRNLPRFMPALRSITINDNRSSHWVVQAPGAIELRWDSEITADDEGERIAWRSRDGSAVRHTGTVHFEPALAGRGCIVHLLMRYEPPMGRASVGVAKLLGHDLNAESRENLRRFKQLIETGEIPTTCGQSSGRRSWLGRLTPEGGKSRPGRLLQKGEES